MIKPLRTGDIIQPAIDSFEQSTDANIDASYHRTLHGSNRVTCVG